MALPMSHDARTAPAEQSVCPGGGPRRSHGVGIESGNKIGGSERTWRLYVPVARGWRAKWTRVARFPLVRAQRRLAGRDDCHGRQDQGTTRSLGVPERAATRAAQRVLWQEAPSETVRSGALPLGVLRACRGRSPAIAQRPRPQCRLHGAAAMRACRTERACAAPAEMSRLGDGGRRSAWGKLRRTPRHIRSSLVTITGARVR